MSKKNKDASVKVSKEVTDLLSQIQLLKSTNEHQAKHISELQKILADREECLRCLSKTKDALTDDVGRLKFKYNQLVNASEAFRIAMVNAEAAINLADKV